MRLANNDRQLPDMVSEYAIDEQTENLSKSNGEENVGSKATR